MADVKFSDLPAGSVPLDNDSLVAISTGAGAPYTSQKFTVTQLRAILREIESSVDGVALNDTDSTAQIDFNADALDDISLSTDSGSFAEGWVGVSNSYITLQAFDGSNGYGPIVNMTNVDDSDIGFCVSMNDSTISSVNRQALVIIDNRAGSTGSNDEENYPSMLSSQNGTVNSAVINSVLLGGDTLTASVDNTAYVNNLVVQNPTVPANASDTGEPGQVTWDADYIYICTATNTWKRAAIATW